MPNRKKLATLFLGLCIIFLFYIIFSFYRSGEITKRYVASKMMFYSHSLLEMKKSDRDFENIPSNTNAYIDGGFFIDNHTVFLYNEKFGVSLVVKVIDANKQQYKCLGFPSEDLPDVCSGK